MTNNQNHFSGQTNSNGLFLIDKIAVPVDGSKEVGLEFGNYSATLIPESESWSNYFKITKGQVNFNVEPNSNNNNKILLGAHQLYN